MEPTPHYWFRAKSYGWGWGLPLTWQGWAVLIGFVALLVVGTFVIPPKVSPIKYTVYVGALSALLIGVCYATGEPPKWHWGR
jgi:hypothetical protein